MAKEILFVFLFFLPAGIANMFPVFAARLPLLKQWNTPLDFGVSWRGTRLLGSHKTIRGLVTGIIAAIVTTLIIFRFTDLGLSVNPAVLGLLLGAGSLVGDAVKSFFKRQSGVPSGRAWFPFDQIDYILGAMAFTFFYVPLSLTQYLLMLVLGFVLHIIVVYVGYLTNLRDQAI